MLEKEIIATNTSSFNIINENAVNIKNDLDQLCFMISYDKQLQNILNNYKQQSKGNSSYMLHQASNILVNYSSGTNSVSQISIFLPDDDLLISTIGIINMKTVYSKYIPEKTNDSISYDEWKADIALKKTQYICQNTKKSVIYTHILPTSNTNTEAVLLCDVNIQKLLSKVNVFNEDGQKGFMLLNSFNEIVCLIDKGNTYREAFVDITNMEKGTYTLQRDGEKLIINVSEKNNGIKCFYAISSKYYWKPLNNMQLIIYLTSLLLLILEIIVALFFSNSNYIPIKKILSSLSNTNVNRNEYKSEYEFIEKSLGNTTLLDIENKKLAEKYRLLSLQHVFAEYLRSGQLNISSKKIFAQFQKDFNYKHYIALLFTINDYGDNFYADNTTPEQENGIVEIAIMNVFRETLGNSYYVYEQRTDDETLFCLIGMNEDGKYDEIHEKVLQAQKYTNDAIGIHYSVLIGGLFHNINDLYIMYLQLADMYKYDSIRENDVISYYSVEWDDTFYKFTQDKKNSLIECIKNGNEKGAEFIINEMFYADRAKKNITQNMKYLKYDVLSCLISLIHNLPDENSKTCFEYADNIDNSNTLNQMLENTKFLSKLLCTIYSLKTGETSNLSDKIIEYINKNYSDPDLNVNALGEVFHLSAGHISKLFKRQTGEALKDYITRVKLSKAEKLLNSNLKIEEIAQKTGFINVGTFIRIFKKGYGETPGSFRSRLPY